MRAPLLGLVVAVGACSAPVNFPAQGSMWPAAVEPEFSHQPRFACTVNLQDEIAFVSANSMMPAKYGAFPVGDNPIELEGPHHLATSPDGKYIYYNLSNYVPGTGSGPHGSHGLGTVPGSMVKIDAATGVEIGEALVDRNPGDVILSADGKYAYVSHYDILRLQAQLSAGLPAAQGYSGIAIVDTDTMVRTSLTMVCPTAHGEGLSPDGKTLYVTCALSDELAIVDVSNPAAPTVTNKLKVGPLGATPPQPVVYSPYALTVSPDGNTVWVSDNASGDVRVYDVQKGAMDDSRAVSVGGVAMFGVFGPDKTTLYVPHQGDDQITTIDTTGKKPPVTTPLPNGSCKNAHVMTIAPDGQNAVLICEGDHVVVPGTAVFLTINPFAIIGYVQLGMFPDGAQWLPPAP